MSSPTDAGSRSPGANGWACPSPACISEQRAARRRRRSPVHRRRSRARATRPWSCASMTRRVGARRAQPVGVVDDRLAGAALDPVGRGEQQLAGRVVAAVADDAALLEDRLHLLAVREVADGRRLRAAAATPAAASARNSPRGAAVRGRSAGVETSSVFSVRAGVEGLRIQRRVHRAHQIAAARVAGQVEAELRCHIGEAQAAIGIGEGESSRRRRCGRSSADRRPGAIIGCSMKPRPKRVGSSSTRSAPCDSTAAARATVSGLQQARSRRPRRSAPRTDAPGRARCRRRSTTASRRRGCRRGSTSRRRRTDPIGPPITRAVSESAPSRSVSDGSPAAAGIMRARRAAQRGGQTDPEVEAERRRRSPRRTKRPSERPVTRRTTSPRIQP